MTTNRWKGLVTGVLGGVAGLLAMRYYWQEVAPQVRARFGAEEGQEAGTDIYPDFVNLDRPFIDGRRYRRGESATAALGRLLYTEITGREPEGEQLPEALSYLTHWGYGLAQGGMYGISRAGARFPDVRGGLRLGSRLWLLGDEIAVPALGLQAGPTAVPPAQHANRLGAHLFYGVATAVVTKLLQVIF